MTHTLKLIVAAAFTLWVWGCTSDINGPETTTGELPRELTAMEKKVISDGQSFNFEIFKNTVAADSVDNTFISPLSISIALGMTLNGADSVTFEQMRNTLALQGISLGEINEAYEALAELLVNADPKVQMQIANSIWHEEKFQVDDEFVQRLQSYFDARVEGLDFDDPASVDIINNWVSENTNGLIDAIIQSIPPKMVMYLINAIYFKGDWMHQFDKEETRKAPFNLENGDQVMVDMMRQERAFAHYFSDEVKMIDLSYGDSLFSMTLMMPADPQEPLDQFIAEKFSVENVSGWVSNLSSGGGIVVQMPKFELEYEKKLNDILKDMGMADAFESGKADFSGINPAADLYISEVKHKTFIKVDEEGTEAAAVTSVGVEVISLPPSFIADRPFVFMIREHNSGAILFMGKVGNPAVS